ncbi:hypothetical protein D3C74_243340 [compost metagenome]
MLSYLKKALSSTVVFSMVLLSGVSVHAEEAKVDYSKYVTELIENYQTPTYSESFDKRFINDMVQKQEEKNNVIQTMVNSAQLNGEEMYTLDQILKADAEEFGISQEDMNRIKSSIQMEKDFLENVYTAFEGLNQENHPLAKSVNEGLEMKYPASMIYVDHALEAPKDGRISGGGWPACLDDNGWGYENFIGSDCSLALLAVKLCVMDSVGSSSLRYCKYDVRNCSPLIFHDKEWHTHF